MAQKVPAISRLENKQQRRIIADTKCQLNAICVHPSKSIKFKNIAVGTQYTMNVEVQVSNPGDGGERPWTTLYIEFDAVQDPGGMFASKLRKVSCAVKLVGVKNTREVREITMDKAYYGVTVWSMEGFRYQSSISIDIQITEPHQEMEECPMSLFLQQKIKMYKDGLIDGDMELMVHSKDKEIESESNNNKRRRIVEEEDGETGIDDGSERIKTFSCVLKSVSPVFESMLSHQMKERTNKVMEIHGATAKDVDDMIYYIICCDLRRDANPRALIRMAHLYELKGLFAACSKRIVSDLEVDNFVESVQVFTRFNIEEGFNELVEFGKLNLKELKDEESFRELPFLFRYGLLKVPGENCHSSDIVCAEKC